MDAPSLEPIRVADVVIDALKRFVGLIKPLTLLTLPAVLFGMVAFGVFFLLVIQLGLVKAGSGGGETWQQALIIVQAVILILGAALFLAYMTFPIMRYVRDTYAGAVHPHLMHYWFPDKTFLGLVGMYCVFLGALVPLLPFILIGFILLILPGAAICLLFGTLTQVMLHQYLRAPAEGVFAAMGRVWQWFTGDWLRMAGFGFLLSVVQCLVSLPGNLLRGCLDIATEFHWVPGRDVLMLLGLVGIPLLGVLFWAQMVLYYGLTSTVIYRFLGDLDVRDTLAAAALAASSQNEPSVDNP